jgi:hypothetical protein
MALSPGCFHISDLVRYSLSQVDEWVGQLQKKVGGGRSGEMLKSKQPLQRDGST